MVRTHSDKKREKPKAKQKSFFFFLLHNTHILSYERQRGNTKQVAKHDEDEPQLIDTHSVFNWSSEDVLFKQHRCARKNVASARCLA